MHFLTAPEQSDSHGLLAFVELLATDVLRKDERDRTLSVGVVNRGTSAVLVGNTAQLLAPILQLVLAAWAPAHRKSASKRG